MTTIAEPPGEEVLEDAVPLGKFGGLGAGLEEVVMATMGMDSTEPTIYIVFQVKKPQNS